MTGPTNTPSAVDGVLPDAAPTDPGSRGLVSAATHGVDATDTVPVAGMRMPLWLIVAALAGFILVTTVGLALVLRHQDGQSSIEDGLSILESPDPPADVTFS